MKQHQRWCARRRSSSSSSSSSSSGSSGSSCRWHQRRRVRTAHSAIFGASRSTSNVSCHNICSDTFEDGEMTMPRFRQNATCASSHSRIKREWKSASLARSRSFSDIKSELFSLFFTTFLPFSSSSPLQSSVLRPHFLSSSLSLLKSLIARFLDRQTFVPPQGDVFIHRVLRRVSLPLRKRKRSRSNRLYLSQMLKAHVSFD